MGTPIYSWLVKSTSDNLYLWLASEVGGGQPCEIEPLTCRVCANSGQCQNWIVGHSAGVAELLGVRKKHAYLVTEVFHMSSEFFLDNYPVCPKFTCAS